ncbi:MAG: RNA polymerase-binding protein DksA [Steroidobacteraceae bacterium]
MPAKKKPARKPAKKPAGSAKSTSAKVAKKAARAPAKAKVKVKAPVKKPAAKASAKSITKSKAPAKPKAPAKAKSKAATAKKSAPRAKVASKTAAGKTAKPKAVKAAPAKASPPAKAKAKAVGKTPASTKTTAKPVVKPKASAPARPAGSKAQPKAVTAPAKEDKGPTSSKPKTEPKRAIAVASQTRRMVQPAAGDDDDGYDGDSRPNLLLGPRNVTPYVEKHGETYMGREQLDHFRNILGSWKQDLMVEVDRTMTHMKDEAANPPDPNDRATLESEFALELRTRDRERKLIRKIEEAMQRIEDGSYGYCLETGEPIGVKRLEARPVATLCIEAQERRERRERQYGDREDWYR